MHRSGTSAVAGILHHYGISMGKNLLAPSFDNPKGFYENEKITIFDDTELFPALKTSWEDTKPIRIKDILEMSPKKDLIQKAIDLINQEYQDKEIFGIKDPRMCVLFPFWEEIFLKLNIEIKIIIPIRNPLEVAYSLYQRNIIPIGQGLYLWAKHVLFAEYYSRKYDRVYISYDNLIENQKEVLKHITNDLKINLSCEQNEFTQSFLDENLKNFNFSINHIPQNTPQFIKDLGFYMEKLSLGEIKESPSLMERFDYWKDQYESTVMNQPFYDFFGSNLKIQLFIDSGEGFQESNSIIKEIEPLKVCQALIFEILLNKPIKALRLDPLNHPCICSFKGITLHENEKSFSLNPTNTNADHFSKETYAFSTDDPQMVFENLPTYFPTLLKILIKYDDIGTSVVNTILKLKNQDTQNNRLSLEHLNHDLERHISLLNQNIVEKDHIISDLSNSLETRNSELGTIKKSLDEKDYIISDLSNSLELREKQIEDLRQLNHDFEGRLTLLNESLRSLKQSTSYQLTRPLRAIGNFLPLSVKRGIRRSVKLMYWGMTPHRMGDRIKKYRLRKLKRRIQLEVLFDRNWYLKQYPDVENSLEDPLDHYLLYGAKEGRNPNPLFDSDWYLEQNPDVKESGINPLHHYLEFGAREGRNPNPLFDTAWYLEQNPDVKNSGMNSLQHYIEFGIKEGRNPHNQPNNYQLWIQKFDTLTDSDRAIFRKAMEKFSLKPLISVLMPVYNTPKKWLVNAIESVRNQIYPHWELCISDNASTLPEVRKVLDHYASRDNRIHVIYRNHNDGISINTNNALTLATGEFVSLLDSDDVLSEHALYWVASEINDYPDVEIIYSDEDKLINTEDEWNRTDPFFKPDFSLHFILTHNMNCLNHLGVYRTSLIKKIGGFNKNFDNVQDFEIALRMIERVSAIQIRHIPRILYHWRICSTSTALSHEAKPNILELSRKSVQAYLDRNKPGSKVTPSLVHPGFRKIEYPILQPFPLVSILLPTAGGFEILKKCLDSIRYKTQYSNYEILIDNGNEDERVLNFLEKLEKEWVVRVIRKIRPKDFIFNYSELNNGLAKNARGEILVLLNDDVELINGDWLNELVSMAIRPEIGAVGAKLYYPNDTIQHAGVVMGVGGCCDHAFAGTPRKSNGYYGLLLTTREVSAVTAAVLAIKTNLFWKVGGLNEKDLKVAFNDVDLCLKIKKEGYLNIWNPYVEFYHYESFTRGYGSDIPGESNFLINKWKDNINHDPYYNPNLSLIEKKETYNLAFPPRNKILPLL